MIKMLIADDEAIVRKGIRNSIDWNKYDIDIVDEAPNGLAALEKTAENPPDIILTDIRMPVMDGLELAKKVKEMFPQIKIVILSGYEEFQYAKQAIKIGVNEYLLKPIRDDVLIELILRLKEQLEKETIERENSYQSKALLNQNMLYFKEKLVKKIIQGEYSDKNMIFQEAKKIKCDLRGSWYTAFVIRMDDRFKYFDSLSESDRRIQEYSIFNIAEETLLNQSCGILAYGEEVTLTGILTGSHNKSMDYQGIFTAIQENVKHYLKISLSIGIGNSFNDILLMPKSYEEALTALEKRFYEGKSSIIYYHPGNTEKNMIYDLSTADEKDFNNKFRNLDFEGIKKKTESLFQVFEQQKADQRNIKSISCRIAANIMACAKEMGVVRRDWQGSIAGVYSTVDKLENLEAVQEWLMNTCADLINEISGNKSRRYNSFVKNALKYMEDNYQKNITLADISAKAFVSPNYLSTIFKEEVGVNFVDWLNRLRVEKAAYYLKETNLKVYEIAERVGFTDYKYFCYVFKKFQKCTPKQYREQ